MRKKSVFIIKIDMLWYSKTKDIMDLSIQAPQIVNEYSIENIDIANEYCNNINKIIVESVEIDIIYTIEHYIGNRYKYIVIKEY